MKTITQTAILRTNDEDSKVTSRPLPRNPSIDVTSFESNDVPKL